MYLGKEGSRYRNRCTYYGDITIAQHFLYWENQIKVTTDGILERGKESQKDTV